jgi:hypothetical protein
MRCNTAASSLTLSNKGKSRHLYCTAPPVPLNNNSLNVRSTLSLLVYQNHYVCTGRLRCVFQHLTPSDTSVQYSTENQELWFTLINRHIFYVYITFVLNGPLNAGQMHLITTHISTLNASYILQRAVKLTDFYKQRSCKTEVQ